MVDGGKERQKSIKAPYCWSIMRICKIVILIIFKLKSLITISYISSTF